MHNRLYKKKGKNRKPQKQQLFSAGIKHRLAHPPLQPTVVQILILIFLKVSLISPPPAQTKMFECI